MDYLPVPDGGERTVFGRRLAPTDRRNFLKWSGTAAATILLVACDTPTEPGSELVPSQRGAQAGNSGGQVEIDLGTDLGILNFAYALEQLEAAFYTKVISDLYRGVSNEEEAILRDIKRHEVVHREFFMAALAGGGIPALAVDFSKVDFASRESVLTTATAFEDLGVGAYNGAGKLIENPDYLLAAGKIVSVEARHASAIRDLLMPRTGYFAPKAFDDAFAPTDVIAAASTYIVDTITVVNS